MIAKDGQLPEVKDRSPNPEDYMAYNMGLKHFDKWREGNWRRWEACQIGRGLAQD
jgi:hypothetical protein